ncbi:ATP-binding protein [Noviherbaspirillum sp.]|uniref:ATP-binding protein n=1 Tax=Noviherbaspirillum sp. TaxID=1926288 RepID=UPI002FDFCA18
MSQESIYLQSLVRELIALPAETEWLELKHNNGDPQQIGEYLSALANSAALCGKAFAFLVWGIDNDSHAVLGTSFDPHASKVGNEELESWLLRQLMPKIDFRFHIVDMDARRVVVLEIGRAFRHPVQFAGQEYIRIGTYKKKLKDFPEKERALWRIFDATPFEDMPALEKATVEDVLRLLDYPAYFDLLEQPLPENRDGILRALASDELIEPVDGGRWNIRNLGAILFAKRLADFNTLKRKAVRVIAYKGTSRVETIREQEGARGYAAGFKGLIDFVNGLLPSNEVIEQALRKTVPIYPELAMRELVANALIHQDFFVTGSGPMVEIFSDRLEITNPGAPLIDTSRFLDNPPRSRNEALASLMRRVGICEERGSGIDKVVFQTELYQLPAPAFETPGDYTRSTLFTPRILSKMDQADRIRAVYLHACLRYVQRDFMTNASLRDRFAIEPQNSAVASRLIKEALNAEVIRPHDQDASRKYMKYVPAWA